MNDTKQPVPCRCAACPGPTCRCGCQQPTAPATCACGSQCACGAACTCPKS